MEMANSQKRESTSQGDGQFSVGLVLTKNFALSKLPGWLKSFVPRIFYVTEKAWNYYPFTVTEYSCSFIPK